MNIFNHPDMRRRIILISVLTLTACCIASTPAAGKRLSDKAVSSTVSTFSRKSCNGRTRLSCTAARLSSTLSRSSLPCR